MTELEQSRPRSLHVRVASSFLPLPVIRVVLVLGFSVMIVFTHSRYPDLAIEIISEDVRIYSLLDHILIFCILLHRMSSFYIE